MREHAPESSSSTAPGWAVGIRPARADPARARLGGRRARSPRPEHREHAPRCRGTTAIDRADGPVVLVAHSYGGVPVTEAGDHPRSSASCTSRRSRSTPVESVIASMPWAPPTVVTTMGRSRDERGPDAHMPPGVRARHPSNRRSVPAAVARLVRRRGLTRRVAGEARDVDILTENDGVVPPAFQESLALRSGARSCASRTVTRRSRRTPPASRTCSSAPSRSSPSRTEHLTRTTEPSTDDRIPHWRRARR